MFWREGAAFLIITKVNAEAYIKLKKFMQKSTMATGKCTKNILQQPLPTGRNYGGP
jgi:hypothetical protein